MSDIVTIHNGFTIITCDLCHFGDTVSSAKGYLSFGINVHLLMIFLPGYKYLII